MDGAEAIELARGLLPPWVGWVNFLLPIALAFLVSLVSTWSAGTVALRLVGDRPCENWADRARRDFPVRRAIALCLVAISLGIGAMGSWFHGPLSPLPGAVFLWLVLTPAYGGGMLVLRRFSRRLGDGSLSPPDSWWRNFAVGLLVFVPSWLVTALVMTSIGNRPDARAVMTLAAGAIATGFFALGGGLLVLRRLGLAAPPSPRLAAIIERVSRRVGVQPRTTFEVRTSMANAFVFPASGVLAFTERALGVLDDDEVAAICAHELGHLAEPRLLHVIRCLEPYLLLPLGALPLVMTSFGARGTAAMVGAIIIASFACRRFRRGREEHADRVAHAHQGEAGVYAHALERLYRANRIPAVLGRRRGSHPELYDRMAAAAAAPPYPRPLPPPRLPTVLGVLAGTAIAWLAAFALVAASARVDRSRHDPASRLWYVALHGEGAPELYQLALARWEEGNHVDAITLYRGAAALAWRSVFYATDLAVALAKDGQCDEATRAAAAARERLRRRPDRDGLRALRGAFSAAADCAGPARR